MDLGGVLMAAADAGVGGAELDMLGSRLSRSSAYTMAAADVRVGGARTKSKRGSRPEMTLCPRRSRRRRRTFSYLQPWPRDCQEGDGQREKGEN